MSIWSEHLSIPANIPTIQLSPNAWENGGGNNSLLRNVNFEWVSAPSERGAMPSRCTHLQFTCTPANWWQDFINKVERGKGRAGCLPTPRSQGMNQLNLINRKKLEGNDPSGRHRRSVTLFYVLRWRWRWRRRWRRRWWWRRGGGVDGRDSGSGETLARTWELKRGKKVCGVSSMTLKKTRYLGKEIDAYELCDN